MDKLIFIYDKLMTAKEQAIASLDLKFVTYGQIRGKLYFLNDDKRRRVFAVPHKGNSTKLVYGGLFILKNYEEQQYKLHAYYNNSEVFTGFTYKEDLFGLESVTVTPIRFNSLSDIESGRYEKKDAVECECFMGNLPNKKIQNSIQRGRYYRVNNVDAKNFIQMVKDRKEDNE